MEIDKIDLPPKVEQLTLQQDVNSWYLAQHPEFGEKLRAHMLDELHRQAARRGLMLLHRPVEMNVPQPGGDVVQLRMFAWAIPYSLKLVWDCTAPPNRQCPVGSTLHGSYCGWRLAPIVN